MISVNRQTEYAIFLIFSLRGRKKPVALARIGKESGLSLRFLAKVAAKLKKEGILESKEGKGGGYRLVIDSKDISLWEIFTIFENPRRIVSCLDGGKRGICGPRSCRLRLFWRKFEKEIWRKLKNISLSEMTA